MANLHFTLAAALFLVASATSCTQWNEGPSKGQAVPFEELDPPQVDQVRDLVLGGQFDTVERVLETTRMSLERDVAFEEQMYLLLDQFYRPMPELQDSLSQWVATQDSANARLARGIYYAAMGWRARGFANRSTTSDEQFRGMREYFELALDDLREVVARRPNDLFARCYAMDIFMNYRAPEALEALLDAVLEEHPLALTPRWFYLNSLEPRWGGSYAEMEQVIADSRSYYPQNPRLRLLEGRVKAAVANDALLAQRYGDALNLYDQALSEGGKHWYYFAGRGEAHMRMRQLQPAIDDLNEALRRRPDYQVLLEYRAWSKYTLGRWDAAIEDYTKLIQLGDNTASQYAARASINLDLGRLEDALADYTMATELEPMNDAFRQARDRLLMTERQ